MAYRTLVRDFSCLPEKVETGSPEAVPTAYSHWVCKGIQADRADEFFLDGFW